MAHGSSRPIGFDGFFVLGHTVQPPFVYAVGVNGRDESFPRTGPGALTILQHAADRRALLSEPEEDNDRSVEPEEILVAEPSDPLSEARSGNGGELVGHQPRCATELVVSVGVDR